MAIDLADFESRTKKAIKLFWGNRQTALQQQQTAGVVDRGMRGAVTSGKNMDGFSALMEQIVKLNGLENATIIQSGRLMTLPGFFRPTKMWDFVVMNDAELVAAIEFKSQVGSFGNNYNNRTEEAIGTAHDFWTAYREGAFGEQPRPFVGWFMLLEDHAKSCRPVNDRSPHFPIRPEFVGASYADRYNELCKKVVQEQLYTASCVLLSPSTAGTSGEYRCMSDLTNLTVFISSFAGHIASVAARNKAKHK